MGLKYLHVVSKITEAMKNGIEEIPRRGGMYNWMFAFKGGIKQWRDIEGKNELEQYDVIQVNLAPADQLLVHEIRRALGNNSSTLLIGNNDYVSEAWDTWGQHPLQYVQTQEQCDAVFGTEEYQVSQMIDGAYCMPHPHFTKMNKRIGNDDLKKDSFKVGVYYHWWEGRAYTQSSVLYKLKKVFPKLFTRLYGYDGGVKCPSKHWVKTMFDKTMPLMNHPEFMQSLQTNRFLYENCHYHTYGRTSVDTAAYGIPTIGTNRVFSMRMCWPKMATEPMDAKTQLAIMKKALSDEGWLAEQVDYAKEACEYFNYENSIGRYMTMVEDTRERLAK